MNRCKLAVLKGVTLTGLLGLINVTHAEQPLTDAEMGTIQGGGVKFLSKCPKASNRYGCGFNAHCKIVPGGKWVGNYMDDTSTRWSQCESPRPSTCDPAKVHAVCAYRRVYRDAGCNTLATAHIFQIGIGACAGLAVNPPDEWSTTKNPQE